MNDATIYFKTPTGEDAVRERTRLVQRNLRMVLILVDGVVDVAALKRSVGDVAMVDSALVELSRMGLIETADAHAARSVQGEMATGTASSTERPVDESDRIPILNEGALEAGAIEVPFSQSPSIFNSELDAGVALASEIRPRSDDRLVVRPTMPRPLASIKNWWQSRKRKRADAHEDALFEKAYGEASEEEAPVVAKPTERVATRKIKLGPLLSIAAATTAVLGISRLVFYPYDEYRPEFEQRLSRMLDDTVKIGNVRVSFMPMPVISLERVSVGATPYANIEAVRMVPEPWALIGGRYQYQQVAVEGMRIQDAGVTKLVRWFSPASMADVRIGKFDVTGLSVGLGRGSLAGLTGSVQLDDQHGLAKLTLRAKEGNFSAEAVPVPGGLMVSIAATDWKAPFQPPLAFAKFELGGRLLPGRFAIDKLEGLAYDGQVSGNGMVGWDDDTSMAVTLNCRHLAAGKLLSALGTPALVEGDMDGRIVVGASAPTVNRLQEALRLDGSFHIARGSLKRYDLASALRGDQGTGTVRGGGTAFENFSGTLSVDMRTVRLSGLRLSSGLMQATGQATVARQAGTITGSASVEMRGSTGTIRAPVTISGNVADPELTASR